MSNREPDGRSKVVDFAKLGRARVQTLLDSGQSGWTPHQQMQAREWVEQVKDAQQAETAAQQAEALKVACDTLDVNRDGVDVGRQTLQVSRDNLSVGRIMLWGTLVGLVIAYLAWKATT